MGLYRASRYVKVNQRIEARSHDQAGTATIVTIVAPFVLLSLLPIPLTRLLR